MRKLLLILLALLVPLQWSIAAMTAHCHEADGPHGPIQHSAFAHAVRQVGPQQAGPATQQASLDDASALAAVAHPADAAGVHAQGGTGESPRDGLPGVDLHACCHGASIPSTMTAVPTPLLPAPFEPPALASAPSSHAPEDLFRPPIPPAA